VGGINQPFCVGAIQAGEAYLEIRRNAKASFGARADTDSRSHRGIIGDPEFSEGATAFIAPIKQAA